MRLTEQEFIDLMAKKKVQRIILPIKLPTWNQLLAMNHWQRKKVRHAIHEIIERVVFTSIINANGLQTQTVFRLKQPLTDSFLSAYLQMITPKSSTKHRNLKKSQSMKKLLLTSFGSNK